MASVAVVLVETGSGSVRDVAFEEPFSLYTVTLAMNVRNQVKQACLPIFSKCFSKTADRKIWRDCVAAPLSTWSMVCSSLLLGVVFCGGRVITCDPGDSAELAGSMKGVWYPRGCDVTDAHLQEVWS